MSALRDCPKNEYLAEKGSFESKYEILRTISQPRTLSADIPAARRGLFTKYPTRARGIIVNYSPINFHIVFEPLGKASVDLKTSGREGWERVISSV